MSTSVADGLPELLLTLTQSAREHLRDVLIRDDADRNAIASTLMRYRDENGQRWADIIDSLTMYPEARRKVIRLLGEIDARDELGVGRRPCSDGHTDLPLVAERVDDPPESPAVLILHREVSRAPALTAVRRTESGSSTTKSGRKRQGKSTTRTEAAYVLEGLTAPRGRKWYGQVVSP